MWLEPFNHLLTKGWLEMWGLREPWLKETNRKEMRPLLKRGKCKGDTEAGGAAVTSHGEGSPEQ